MIIITRKWTRPSTDVQFWKISPEGGQLFNQKYKDKCLYRNKTLENNDLTMVIQTIWDSAESHSLYAKDPDFAVHFAQRNQYNTENNIVTCERVVENA